METNPPFEATQRDVPDTTSQNSTTAPEGTTAESANGNEPVHELFDPTHELIAKIGAYEEVETTNKVFNFTVTVKPETSMDGSSEPQFFEGNLSPDSNYVRSVRAMLEAEIVPVETIDGSFERQIFEGNIAPDSNYLRSLGAILQTADIIPVETIDEPQIFGGNLDSNQEEDQSSSQDSDSEPDHSENETIRAMSSSSNETDGTLPPDAPNAIEEEADLDSPPKIRISKCMCSKPCWFQLEGKPETRTTSPIRLIRMWAMLKRNPNAGFLKELSHHPLPWSYSFGDWQFFHSCPTYTLWNLNLIEDVVKEEGYGEAMMNEFASSFAGNNPVWVHESVNLKLVPLCPEPTVVSVEKLERNEVSLKPGVTQMILVIAVQNEECMSSLRRIFNAIDRDVNILLVPAPIPNDPCQEIDAYQKSMEAVSQMGVWLTKIMPKDVVKSNKFRTLIDTGSECTPADYWKTIRTLASEKGFRWEEFYMHEEAKAEPKRSLPLNRTAGTAGKLGVRARYRGRCGNGRQRGGRRSLF